MVRITTPELAQAFIDEQVAAIREQIGDKKVLLALSGGVDSSVVATLLIKAIGKQLICVHVNNGLMRKGESEQVIDVFKNQMDANLVYVDATDRFLGKLVDVAEPVKLLYKDEVRVVGRELGLPENMVERQPSPALAWAFAASALLPATVSRRCARQMRSFARRSTRQGLPSGSTLLSCPTSAPPACATASALTTGRASSAASTPSTS